MQLRWQLQILQSLPTFINQYSVMRFDFLIGVLGKNYSKIYEKLLDCGDWGGILFLEC
ncbi:hypothetical protein pb186bvf_000887 [Paramecium bursaria]